MRSDNFCVHVVLPNGINMNVEMSLFLFRAMILRIGTTLFYLKSMIATERFVCTMSKHYYMNLETGELLTYKQMIEQAEELYDFGD